MAPNDFYLRLIDLSNTACTLANEFWEKRDEAVTHEHMLAMRPLRTRGHQDIVRLVNRFRELQGGLEPQEELQARLGLWLCSYFLGFPLPHLWERIRHLDPVVDGYAGTGALYDKLAGDVYRGERKVRDRMSFDPRTTSGSQFDHEAPILSLAFSPTALIPDEDWSPEGEHASGDVREMFLSHLSHLAGRYLRLQMWLYFSSGNPLRYPIRYAFVIEYAAESLARHYPDADAATMRALVEARFEKMGGDKKNLFGVYSKVDQKMWNTWMSCTLGVEDGVLSDSPQAHLSHRHFTWATGDFLRVSREKVARLTTEGRALSGDEAIDAVIAEAMQVKKGVVLTGIQIVSPEPAP